MIHKKVWRSRRHDKQTDLEHKRIRSGVHLAVPPAIATMPPYTHPPIASGARHLVHVLSPARWWRPPASLASPVSGSPVQDSLLSNSRAGVRQERPRGRGGGSPYPSGTSEVQQLGAASLGPSRGVRGLWAFEITPTRGGGILWAPSGHCPKRMGRGEITCHGGATQLDMIHVSLPYSTPYHTVRPFDDMPCYPIVHHAILYTLDNML